MGIPLLHPWANRLAPAGVRRRRSDRHAARARGPLRAGPQWPADPRRAARRSRLAGLTGAGRPRARAAGLGCARAAGAVPVRARARARRGRLATGSCRSRPRCCATGSDPVPVSFGFHPYLALPGGRREEWRVALGASAAAGARRADDPDGRARSRSSSGEFSSGTRIGTTAWRASTLRPCSPSAPSGRRLTVTFDEGFAWAQVYAPAGEDFICFEPMTAPTDALNSGDGLIVARARRAAPDPLHGDADRRGGSMDLTFTERRAGVPRRAARLVRRQRPGPEPERRRGRALPLARATSSASSPRAAGRPCTGRSSTAAAARR